MPNVLLVLWSEDGFHNLEPTCVDQALSLVNAEVVEAKEEVLREWDSLMHYNLRERDWRGCWNCLGYPVTHIDGKPCCWVHVEVE